MERFRVAPLKMITFTVILFTMVHNIGTNTTVFGQIKTDTRFYYQKLSNYSLKFAEIQYSIWFKNKLNKTISLDIYTTEDDLNLETNCSRNIYGQLMNGNIHTPMRPRSEPYRFTTCVLDGINSDTVHCEGKATIQDYKPRHYGFSFGYQCVISVRPSLRGLSFNFTISGQTNETTCTEVPDVEDGFFNCHQLYTYTSLPNLIGSVNKTFLQHQIKNTAMSPIFGIVLSQNGRLCHKYARELLCHALYPRCDSVKEQVIPPCKEVCDEFIEACSESVRSSLRKLHFEGSLFSPSLLRAVDTVSDILNCDHLPLTNSTIPCFYQPVTCQPPSNVTNARIMNSNQQNGS